MQTKEWIFVKGKTLIFAAVCICMLNWVDLSNIENFKIKLGCDAIARAS